MFHLPGGYWAALGARAVACPHWAGTAEMSTLEGDPIADVDGALLVREMRTGGDRLVELGLLHLPHLNDDVTCDLLLDLVREVRGDPHFDVRRISFSAPSEVTAHTGARTWGGHRFAT